MERKKRKKRSKGVRCLINIGKLTGGIATVLLVLFVLDYVLYPCTFMRNDIHTVTTEAHQDVFLGTSHGKINIDPEVVSEETGRSAHNLCVGGEYAVDAYYLTKLMLETEKPERIIYEVDPGYFVTEKEVGNNYLLFYHEFPISAAKLEYFQATMMECDFRTVLFPWYEYIFKYDLEKVWETVYQKWMHDYDVSYLKGSTQEYHESGFIERYPIDTTQLSIEEEALKLFTKDSVKQQNMEYLKKLIDLCKENDIEFIAVSTPVPAATLVAYEANYQEAWTYFADFFEKEEIRYLNFNREYFTDFSHEITNFTDYDGHMNGDAAREYSRVLGKVLDAIPSMG